LNIASLLSNTASKYPRREALVSGRVRRSYEELESRAGRLAGALLGLGLEPGDRVALLSFNSDYLVESYLALVRVGLVATPVNFRLAGPEIAYILNDSGAKAIIHGPEFARALAEIRDQAPKVKWFISPESDDSGLAMDYEALLQDGPWVPSSAEIKEDHPCQIMYTSGTTGRPKGAVITHRNVIWNLFNTIYGREDRAGQVSIVVGPLYHTAALNNHLTIQMTLGGTCILIAKFDPQTVLETIEREKATTISGSPAMYNLLMQHPAAGGCDTSSITKCTAGADKLPMATKQRLMEFFPNINGIYDVYGCTEASPCITILGAADSLRKDGSVGKALPYLDARVVGEDGRPLPAGEVGEIVCRGPNVMQGYHNDPDATKAAIRDGWLHTGDLARMDEEGFFYIVDRKKDMIVSGGENIYPREVEEILYTHPDILEAAMVGMPDPTWGESGRVFVVPKQGRNLSAQDVIEFCKQHLASYKKPKRVDFLKELPRNASGKVLKVKLRQMPMGDRDGQGEPGQ
jgi:acyl-CoA synthetase (AMP-forming)/AMP-acid ligase II